MKTPYTIARLEALRSGEEFTYYVGNLGADISRCAPVSNAPGAPTCRKLLLDIGTTAQALVNKGRVRLYTKQEVREARGVSVAVTRYIAVGA